MSTLAQSRGVSFSFHVFLSMRIFLVPRSPMKDFNLSLRQEVFESLTFTFFAMHRRCLFFKLFHEWLNL